MENNKRIIIVGIPGVGKTTIVDKVQSLLREKGKVVEYLIFGSIMMKEAEKIGVKDRDDLRKLPVTRQKEIQLAASSFIGNIRSEILLVDTHLFIKTKEGYWPGIPFEVAKDLSPTHIILIEALPSEIISRRIKDTSRKRDFITENDVLEELTIAKNMLSALGVLTGAAIMFVQNSENKVNEATNRILSAIGIE